MESEHDPAGDPRLRTDGRHAYLDLPLTLELTRSPAETAVPGATSAKMVLRGSRKPITVREHVEAAKPPPTLLLHHRPSQASTARQVTDFLAVELP